LRDVFGAVMLLAVAGCGGGEKKTEADGVQYPPKWPCDSNKGEQQLWLAI
jgi:hypothetical protein